MNFIKKNKNIILSFSLPIIIFLIGLAFNKVIPFGEKSISIYDGGLQHPGFLSYFSEVLKGNESLFYSFKGGLGYNFFSTFVYYLSNPTNIFVFFLDKINYDFLYLFLILLRIGLCGTTMCIYLNSKDKKNIFNIVFSICYALMSYNIVYFSNFMWTDSIIIFPLVIMGLDKLINKEGKKLYIFFLTFSILSNFYIGYMICLFSLIYFVYNYFLLNKHKRKNIIKDFIVCSVCAGLMSMIFIIPVFFELLLGKSDLFNNTVQTNYFLFNMNFINVFYKLMPASFSSNDIAYGTPNVYVSLFAFVLFVLFFFNSKFKKKEKILTFCLFCFFILSFSFNLIDYSWHLFQRPIWFPTRYSFIFSFFIIIVAYKSFANIKYLNFTMVNKILLTIPFILVLVIASTYNGVYLDKLKIIFTIFSILLLMEYIFIIDNKKFYKLLILLVVIELSCNTICSFKKLSFSSTTEYKKISDNINYKYINLIEKKDNEFYRMELNNTHHKNTGAFFNYNGISYFNSLRNSKAMNFLGNNTLNILRDECSINYKPNEPVTNAFLGIKYFRSNANEYYYKNVSTDKNMKLYYNEDAINLGFVGNNNALKKINEENMFTYLNTMFNNMMNKNINLYEQIKPIKINDLKIKKFNKKDYYFITGENPKIIYEGISKNGGFLILTDKNSWKNYKVKLYINNTLVKEDSNRMVNPFLEKNDTYRLEYVFNEENVEIKNLELYFVDYLNYMNFINYIKNSEMKILTYEKDDYIKSSVTVKNDEESVLITTIPYSKGWNIFVDGKKNKYDLVSNAFIGVPLTKGRHIVEFKFIPRGLFIGIILFVIGIICSVIYTKK